MNTDEIREEMDGMDLYDAKEYLSQTLEEIDRLEKLCRGYKQVVDEGRPDIEQRTKEACEKRARFAGMNHHCITSREIEQIIRSVVVDMCRAIMDDQAIDSVGGSHE